MRRNGMEEWGEVARTNRFTAPADEAGGFGEHVSNKGTGEVGGTIVAAQKL